MIEQFTVREVVQLRADPDPASSPIATVAPGDRIQNSMTLGDWSKVSATGEDGEHRTGWIPAQFLKRVVGRTVQLHFEPLSPTFMIVTGTLETVAEVANWTKVRVTTETEVRVGWIDVNVVDADNGADIPADPVVEPEPERQAAMSRGSGLRLGVNEVFRAPLLKAEAITKIDAAALAALIDAEAAKIASGPDKGRWNAASLNAQSGAAGLTQFLRSTWLDHARNGTTLLNQVAKAKGLVTSLDGIVASREAELLDLCFDAELSIVAAAEFGARNLATLEEAGLIAAGIGDDERARFMYVAHHEGGAGAKAFLRGTNSADFGKFSTQVGAQKARALTDAAGGDVALAYRRWLEAFMDERIRPDRFRAGAPAVVVPGTKALAAFDGLPLDLLELKTRRDLVREVQHALTELGYLDPPADGILGRSSIWALTEFCRLNRIPLATGFSRDVARALLNPDQQLPSLAARGDWFDKAVAYMGRKGHWICRHPDAVNIVYLEGIDADGVLNDDRPNVFNDLRVTFSVGKTGVPAITGQWDATSEPGTHWTMNPMSPDGAARIAFGQYKAWMVGIHLAGEASAHEGLVQRANVTVHRDLNKDFKRTGDQTFAGLFGINQHWGHDASPNDLGNTSAGCLVGRTKEGHREFMALVKADPRFAGNAEYKFMSAVLPADEVMAG